MDSMNAVWLCLGLGAGWWVRSWLRRSPSTNFDTYSSESAQADIALLQEQLQQTELAYYMAAEMSQLKSSFLARTSHELRSPMNGIIGMHQLILADLSDSPEEEREFIAQANASALKMVKVLDEVIDAAKVEHGTSQLMLQPVPLAVLLRETQTLTHLQAQNRNLRLIIETPEPETYILADPQRLRQVLVSLVDAAIAQMPEGRLSLTTQYANDAETCEIVLQTPIAASLWLEETTHPPTIIPANHVVAVDKAAILALANRPFPSPGFAFAVARSLMQSMQGHLNCVTVDEGITDDVPTASGYLSQIRCTIPRVLPEASVD
jgi:hypothetical protein